jgi:hypothetical protein
MPRPLINSDNEEHHAQEIDGHEDSNSSRKRIQKPSTKKKEIGKSFKILYYMRRRLWFQVSD